MFVSFEEPSDQVPIVLVTVKVRNLRDVYLPPRIVLVLRSLHNIDRKDVELRRLDS